MWCGNPKCKLILVSVKKVTEQVNFGILVELHVTDVSLIPFIKVPKQENNYDCGMFVCMVSSKKQINLGSLTLLVYCT